MARHAPVFKALLHQLAHPFSRPDRKIRYQEFTKDSPGLCDQAHLVPAHLTFPDLYGLALEWISPAR